MIVGNRYELRPEQGIKKGRYSKLYKAKDKKTGLWVTVKFIDENLSGLHSETFKGKWNLIKHPNLLHCLSSFNVVIDLGDGNREYLVIVNEYLAGAPISHHYAKFENEAFFKEIVSEILAGFDFLHGLNLVHRDIKCSNIFLCNEGRGLCAKLTDMDMVGEQGQKPTHFIGTPEYSAPEVFLMKPLNEGSDFWSLGCVLRLTFGCWWPGYAQRKNFGRYLQQGYLIVSSNCVDRFALRQRCGYKNNGFKEDHRAV